jgi:hypothetical protein
MPLHRRPNPTDPGDAADLSTPQGIRMSRKQWGEPQPPARSRSNYPKAT